MATGMTPPPAIIDIGMGIAAPIIMPLFIAAIGIIAVALFAIIGI